MSNLDKYMDPENKDEILKKIRKAETHSDVVKIINDTFPDWIMGWPKKYSDDYSFFTTNWQDGCEKLNCKPLCIIIVDKIVFHDKNYSVIQMFCELLTLFGHSVRRKEEFFECKFCGKILPTEPIYDGLKKSGALVPQIWSMKCTNC